jgi:predicted nucleotidyltransferase
MEIQVQARHQEILARFVEACQADERIVAAFLVGSYVKGQADEHSDLDLVLITRDNAHADFVADREDFVCLLGEPLFIEDFDIPNIVLLIFASGAEVELQYVPLSQVNQIFNAPHELLLDKENIHSNITPAGYEVDIMAQSEKLRHLIYTFWHDFSHFVTAISRNQLWWASGQLEILRSICVNLARLQNNFSDPEIGDEPYFKIEKALSVEVLAPLRETFCPMDKEALRKAAYILLEFYKAKAVPLAHSHGIAYPEQLEQVMVQRLEKTDE